MSKIIKNFCRTGSKPLKAVCGLPQGMVDKESIETHVSFRCIPVPLGLALRISSDLEQILSFAETNEKAGSQLLMVKYGAEAELTYEMLQIGKPNLWEAAKKVAEQKYDLTALAHSAVEHKKRVANTTVFFAAYYITVEEALQISQDLEKLAAVPPSSADVGSRGIVVICRTTEHKYELQDWVGTYTYPMIQRIYDLKDTDGVLDLSRCSAGIFHNDFCVRPEPIEIVLKSQP